MTGQIVMPSAYVVGLGKSGIAAARLLKREGWTVTVSDRTASDTLHSTQQQLESEGITVKLGHTLEPDPNQIDRIVVSPGVPWDAASLLKARELGIETLGEMELAWRSLSSIPWVGITGTNGKTTTTALIAAIFQAAGLNAPACGNIGYAACELALSDLDRNSPPLDWVIAELSSYQIESANSLKPKIAIWTTFTPDHLNRHYTLDNYYAIKAQLLETAEYPIFNGDDPYLREHAPQQWPDAYWTSIHGKAKLPGDPDRGFYIEDAWVRTTKELILPVNLLRMPGAHNRQNLLMAVAAARLANINKEAIARAIASFSGVPHRLERILTWQGIEFINDSKATNYDAAQVGLSSVASPAILIAGGEAKAGDDTQWIDTIHQKAAAVLLIGSAAPAFAQRLGDSGYTSFEIVETLERAIPRAAELAKHYNAKVVLLSPACASFDQYPNFEQRGEHFRQLSQSGFGKAG